MRSKTPSLVEMKQTCAWKLVCSSNIGGDISDQNYLEITISLIKMTYHTYHSHSNFFKNYFTKPMKILRELITQASDLLQSNPIVACSPSLNGGLHANKKNEIWSAGSQDISSLNLGVVNSSQTYGITC